MTCRVRFAPSPTGYLHIGGARTALFSWLWARKQGGAFVLRIEDTDRERNLEDSVGAILTSMQWLGLDWDEGPGLGGAPDKGDYGPYVQSQRAALYRDYADKLIRTGAAFRCYCTKEELQQARDQHAASGARSAFRYPGTCRSRRDQPDKPFVVRFKAPTQGITGWVDRVKGRIDVPNDTQQDFVLLRDDGVPLYNFGCVVDDLTMAISLVTRGEDHVINTPAQILIYEALGAPLPEFAHVPMILAPNGEKLSKRHAAVSVLEYRDQGYLPDAVLNYLARLGWSHGDQEIFSRHELLEHFDWAQVGRTAARYDAKKFSYVQAEHLRRLPPGELAALVAPLLREQHLHVDAHDPRLLRALGLVVTRAATLPEVADGVAFFFRPEVSFEADAKAKFLQPAQAPLLRSLADLLEQQDPFEQSVLEPAVKHWLEQSQLELKTVAQPARVALTGRSRSPGLFEVMELLGKTATLARLRAAAALAEQTA